MVFLIHEVGHYITASLCNVRIDTVTIGFGREIWARTDHGGTRWSVRMYPVCGLVRLYHQEDGASERDQRAFNCQKLWKRALIVAAGPLANMLLAFMSLALFYTVAGRPVSPPIVAGVDVTSPAYRAGFEPGDRIIAFEGKPILSDDKIHHVVWYDHGSRLLSFTVDRGGKTLQFSLRPDWVDYLDELGFQRQHGRTGLLLQNFPFVLTAVESVQGVSTHEQPALARELLLKNLGRKISIGLKGDDRKTHVFKARPLADLNKGLADRGSKDYDWVYLSTLTDNIYLIERPADALTEALRETGRIAGGLTQLLGRVSHMDMALIEPELAVRPSDAPAKYTVFFAVYKIVLLSLCIGLINLLPLPGMDGSYLLVFLFEACVGPERARVIRPYVQRLAVLLLVSVWLLVNTSVLAVVMRM